MSTVLESAQDIIDGIQGTIDIFLAWLPEDYATVLGAVLAVLLVLAVKRALFS